MFGVSNTQKSLQSKCYTKVRNILEWHKTRNDKEAGNSGLFAREELFWLCGCHSTWFCTSENAVHESDK